MAEPQVVPAPGAHWGGEPTALSMLKEYDTWHRKKSQIGRIS
jgi:hypothetical protein